MKSLQLTQKTQTGKTVITLVGQIDENSDYTAVNFAGVREATFNFEGVSLINSTGLQRWVKFMESIPASITVSFERCPVRVIGQINMFPGFLAGRSVAITSFFAPYYCEPCDRSSHVLLDQASSAARAEDGAPDLKCEKCGGGMEFDGIEKKFFLFLKSRAA